MIDERWARVKALFEAAVARPAAERSAFLATTVADDDALRHEVESLLASEEQASFLDRLPLAGAAAVTVPHRMLRVGHRINAYEVIEPIGAGAMGEVYRGRDTKLNRDVALKVLPALSALDPERLARFRREAQLLATINHPNIAAIYGLEESADVQALVLELVDGQRLADRIAGRPVPWPDALPMARQIVEALEAAHEHGIVHRDLKPSNVIVRPDGVVKVLDFGLAKALAPAAVASDPGAPDPGVAGTREGLILGTAAYMSPEQARGQLVDKRSDIWSFGCVLFEMLSGRSAFRGETVTDLLASVVKDEPDWSGLPADLPAGIHTLLRRLLKKDPRQRLQAIGDARIEIDSIDEAPPTQPRARISWLPWLAIATCAGVVVFWEFQRTRSVQTDPFATAQFSRLTDWEGTEGAAEISPDGQFVAFLADKDGEFDIWLNQIGTGVSRNITRDIPPLQPSFTTFRKIGFSGEGAQIWFGVENGPSMAQMLMPMMGGPTRPFLDRSATAPSWSRDGTRLIYFKNVDGDPMFVADRTGADAKQIYQGEHNHNPVWSADGNWIYFAHGADPTEAMDLWRIRPSGGEPERLTEGVPAVSFISSLDARTLLYIARAEDQSGPWLWALDVERKTTRRVSSGVGQYTSVSSSRDGSRVVATVSNPTASLWRVPLGDREASERDVERYPVPTTRALAPRFAGTSLFYLSSSSSGDGLWRFAGGQTAEVWRSADGGLFEPPAISPDGSRAVVIVRREGRRQLLLVSSDGRVSRTIAPSIDILGAARQGTTDWSPDGKWIVTGGSDSQGPGLFRISADTGLPVRLVTGKAENPVWSPTQDLIVYSGAFFTGQVELRGVRQDGTPVALPPTRMRPGGYRFLPDGTGVVYLPFIPSLDFWLLDLGTKTSRQLTRLGNRGSLTAFDVTPDGTAIVFDRSLPNSDIVLIDLR